MDNQTTLGMVTLLLTRYCINVLIHFHHLHVELNVLVFISLNIFLVHVCMFLFSQNFVMTSMDKLDTVCMFSSQIP